MKNPQRIRSKVLRKARNELLPNTWSEKVEKILVAQHGVGFLAIACSRMVKMEFKKKHSIQESYAHLFCSDTFFRKMPGSAVISQFVRKFVFLPTMDF